MAFTQQQQQQPSKTIIIEDEDDYPEILKRVRVTVSKPSLTDKIPSNADMIALAQYGDTELFNAAFNRIPRTAEDHDYRSACTIVGHDGVYRIRDILSEALTHGHAKLAFWIWHSFRQLYYDYQRSCDAPNVLSDPKLEFHRPKSGPSPLYAHVTKETELELCRKGYYQCMRVTQSDLSIGSLRCSDFGFCPDILTSPDKRIALLLLGLRHYQLYEVFAVIRHNRLDLLEEMETRDAQVRWLVDSGAALWYALLGTHMSEHDGKEDCLASTRMIEILAHRCGTQPLGLLADFSNHGTNDGTEKRGFEYYVKQKLLPPTCSYLGALRIGDGRSKAEVAAIVKLLKTRRTLGRESETQKACLRRKCAKRKLVTEDL